MQSKYLLPHKYRRIGWLVLIPFAILGLANLHLDFAFGWLDYSKAESDIFAGDTNFTNELAAIGTLIGLILIAFSREQVEDEFVAKLRLDSLLIAVLVNYVLLFLAIVFLYDFSFYFALVYNMYTTLILFIARFYWVKRKQTKELAS